MTAERARVRTHRDDNVLLISLDRASKMNAFDLQMLRELAEALTVYERDPQLRCAVLCAEGAHFTAGLDLAEVGPAVAKGAALFPTDCVDPLNLRAPLRAKPLVTAVGGWCLTIGIELLLASDIRVSSEDTRFGQIEINRGIFPFGGATVRLPQVAGWGNAMRWLLTGDKFDAAEAHRIGLVQDVVPAASLRDHALQIAKTVASRAPLGVQATLSSAQTTMQHGELAAIDKLLPTARTLMDTEDAAEGVASFLERRDGVFKGR